MCMTSTLGNSSFFILALHFSNNLLIPFLSFLKKTYSLIKHSLLKSLNLFFRINGAHSSQYKGNNAYDITIGVIWYFDPHGKLLKTDTPLYGKLNAHGILTPLISNQ